MPTNRKILILIDWFLPGIKAGGPIKSVSAIVNQLHDNFDFYILTTDTDFGDKKPYHNITSNEWVDYKGKSKICYLSKEKTNATTIAETIALIEPDAIYINSFYSKFFSIIPLKILKKINFHGKIILAPRGMLSPGALQIKYFKKKTFILFAKLIGLHENIVWHSTKADETIDIKRVYRNAKIIEIQNLPDVKLQVPNPTKNKQSGELRLIYLGRIAENKNLILLLNALHKIDVGSVILDIYGNIEDKTYWNKCENVIENLESNITVQFKGILSTELVQQTISKHHYLVLLSYSENYGHAIVEAFSCGTPVIISNATPWKDLPFSNAGWDVEINSIEPTIVALRSAIAQNNETYQQQAIGAYNFAKKNCFDERIKQDFIEFFN